jgi:hypothetical protein
MIEILKHTFLLLSLILARFLKFVSRHKRTPYVETMYLRLSECLSVSL